MHPVGFIIRIYHDARSSECQILSCSLPRDIRSTTGFVVRFVRPYTYELNFMKQKRMYSISGHAFPNIFHSTLTPTPINIDSIFHSMLSLLRKTTCMVSVIQKKKVWYVSHSTLNSRDMSTSQAKPLTVITKPHDHKTGNRKKGLTYTKSGPKVTWHCANTTLSSQDTQVFFFFNFESKVIKTVVIPRGLSFKV